MCDLLASALDELSANLDCLATMPSQRFASIHAVAVCELRSVAASLSISAPDDESECAGVAATMVSLQFGVTVSAQAVRQRR